MAENLFRSGGEQPVAWPAHPAHDIDEFPTQPLPLLARAPRVPAGSLPGVAAVLDLGDKVCGDGPLEAIANALHAIPPGAGLEVRTTDGDVAVALIAWCRFQGYAVADQRSGRFLILPAVPSR